MRVIVTGGAGFIGSHLCDWLIADGHEVVCLDNFSTGHERNIQHLYENERFSVRRQNVVTLLDEPADRIYNLACPASPVHYQADPIGTMLTCVAGAMNVLQLARKTGARVLQASTSEVYGDPEAHPQTEDYWGNVNPIGPRACYDEGKRAAEALFYDYHRKYGVEIRVARIFNTYGPRMATDDGRVVPTFITQALAGNPLTIHVGSQTRSFCYVDDMIEGLVMLMESSESRPVNLGNPPEFTINELAKTIWRLTDTSAINRQWTRPTDDPQRRCPDILRARMLGWEPMILLDDGLKRTIAAQVDICSQAA